MVVEGIDATPPQSPVKVIPSSPTGGRQSRPVVTTTTSTTNSPSVLLSPISRFAARRRALEVDGRPLDHWDRRNFQPKRDASCRLVYEPKEGRSSFFQQHLQRDDYVVMQQNSLLFEQPYFSKYNRFFPKRGHFCCKACGNALYAHQTKFDANDGWPAFGACVEGSIGIQTTDQRREQIKTATQACIKLQALTRGVLCRIRVNQMLEELIQDLLRQKGKEEGHKVTEPRQQQQQQQQHDQTKVETEEEGEFGEDIFEVPIKDATAKIATNVTTVNRKYTGRYTWMHELGDEYMEIHCHRCKCHLGDIVEDDNDGRQEGQVFQERHRVNGRALKYVEDDLPRRIRVDCSLLFANETQRRLLGLPERKKASSKDDKPLYTIRTTPFVSPRTRRRTLSGDRGVSFRSPQKDERWSTTKGSNNNSGRRGGRRADSLSVSLHERAMQVPFLDHSFSNSETANNDNEGSSIVRRPRRKTSINIQERKAALENFILSKSMH